MNKKIELMVSEIFRTANHSESFAELIMDFKDQEIVMEVEMLDENTEAADEFDYPDLTEKMHQMAKLNSEKKRFMNAQNFNGAAIQREKELALINVFKGLGLYADYHRRDPVLYQLKLVKPKVLRLRVFTLSEVCKLFITDFALKVNLVV